ncbi:MAG: virulence RhuM family protein [Candidatus Peribacteraceae bacterium]|nr:virulence RhuM family protein [Candidatus Peribacteraceae bacterium]
MLPPATSPAPSGNIILFVTKDGTARIEVRMEGETVWLTQDQMADLFDKSKSTINEHIGNVYSEGELKEADTMRKFGISELSTKPTNYYNLDVIISVGYRVKSQRGTQFRIWATQRLREYIVKGFALDDERLKQGGGRARYFEELLQRIRDIRSSERNFYQKVTDIYATSVDYRKNDLLTRQFFATVQNKMHYAVHGHTAAEIIHERADNSKPMMGLTSFKGRYMTAGDVRVAKNYLSEKELKQLNLIVSFYLDFAELQASNERPMTMADWVNKLDDFLKLSEQKLLKSAGTISAETAGVKADAEFLKYRKERDGKHMSDFDYAVKKLSDPKQA